MAILLFLLVLFIGRQYLTWWFLRRHYETFFIHKGKHRSTPWYWLIARKRRIRFKVIFNETVRYQCQDLANQYDINKLLGFCDGWHHHLHSVRLGWNYRHDKLWLYPYVYNNGKVAIDPPAITAVPLNKEVECEIMAGKGVYHFWVNGVYEAVPRTGGSGLPYMLWPFFGGNERAGSTMVFQIKML